MIADRAILSLSLANSSQLRTNQEEVIWLTVRGSIEKKKLN